MLGASFISTLIGTRLPGPGALWVSQSFDFMLPVRLEDVLTIRCKVLKKYESEQLIELEAEILNQHNQQVLRGVGKVKILDSEYKTVTQNSVPYQPKVAIVTGGGGDIGQSICLDLAELGLQVAVHYHSSSDRAHRIVEKIIKADGVAQVVQADLGAPKAVKKMLNQISETWGMPDVIVHNASPPIAATPTHLLNWDSVQTQLDVQVRSFLEISNLCFPTMKENGFGRIIAITSQILDGLPTPKWAAYSIAKSSLATLCRSYAIEFGPHGITANCVSPSLTDTRFVGDLSAKAKMILARQNPTRRLCQPADIANAVKFLASKESSYVNGETIRLNGGKVML
jgi:3-oxoacyl-[acyl-carrier protein] reductase